MMQLIDMHCDTILECMIKKTDLTHYNGHINLEKLRAGGCLAQCFALWIPTNNEEEMSGIHITDSWKMYKDLFSCFKENMNLFSDKIKQAFSPEDISENENQGLLSAILTVEDGMAVEGKMDRLDEMYKDGVRMLALTWNYENCFGFPNSFEADAHAKGLKAFGIEAVQHMNELGMIIDVSHLSEGGFFDVAKYSSKPFVASHSNARALCNHSRNLTDKQLRVLADRGGIAGLNFYSEFLQEGSRFTRVEDVIRHFDYMRNRCGVEGLALGSDFDGIDNELEFKDYAGYPMLIDALTGTGGIFTDDEMDKITGGNFLRVFRDNV